MYIFVIKKIRMKKGYMHYTAHFGNELYKHKYMKHSNINTFPNYIYHAYLLYIHDKTIINLQCIKIFF